MTLLGIPQRTMKASRDTMMDTVMSLVSKRRAELEASGALLEAQGKANGAVNSMHSANGLSKVPVKIYSAYYCKLWAKLKLTHIGQRCC